MHFLYSILNSDYNLSLALGELMHFVMLYHQQLLHQPLPSLAIYMLLLLTLAFYSLTFFVPHCHYTLPQSDSELVFSWLLSSRF